MSVNNNNNILYKDNEGGATGGLSYSSTQYPGVTDSSVPIDPTGKTYYDILGVGRGATEDEIRRAYRRLALVLHPDRAGSESAGRFKELNIAYNVLIDKAKRSLYDRLGDREFTAMENGGAFNPTEGGTGSGMDGENGIITFERVRKSACTFSLSLFALTTLILLFLVFLSRKVDRKGKIANWPWTVVAIPLYVASGFFYVVFMSTFHFLKASFLGGGSLVIEVLYSVVIIIHLVLCVVFLSILPTGLSRQANGKAVNWWLYFIPLFAGEILNVLSSVLDVFVSRAYSYNYVLSTERRVTHSIGIIACLIRLAGVFLICGKIQAPKPLAEASWWLIFIPLYVYVVLSAIRGIYSVNTFLKRMPGSVSSSPSGQQKGSVVLAIFISYLAASVLLVLCLINAKIQENSKIQLIYCLIPVFIFISLLYVLSLISCCFYCCSSDISSSE